MKKVVVKLDLHDDKDKKKVMKTVSRLSGIESIAIDMKEQKLTITGNVDPVVVVSKLRKGNWHTQILTVGPKEEKKDEAKKDDSKKDEAKKDEGKKDESKKDAKPKDQNEQNIAEPVKLYWAYNPYTTQYYHVVSVEENPNACVIC